MSSVGEGDQPAEEPKPVTKEKKPKVPKEKARQPKTVSHPPYFQMIKEALWALNEKGGSSPYAIAKYMEEKHKSVLPGNFRKMLALQLKNQAARGKLIKIKASYKLSSEAGKKGRDTAGKVTRSATQKTQRSKRSAPKKAETGKKAKKAARKVVGVKKTKKSSTAAKPKQPKSLRSSSKRTRKVTASAS